MQQLLPKAPLNLRDEAGLGLSLGLAQAGPQKVGLHSALVFINTMWLAMPGHTKKQSADCATDIP